MTLGEYLKAPRPAWNWGTFDCCTWVAAWVIASGHADPMGFIRGRYATELGAIRAIRRGGGLAELWSRGMGDAGCMEVGTPRAGDVAVLSIPTEDRLGEACGIWTGDKWGCLHFTGLVFGIGAPQRIWRV